MLARCWQSSPPAATFLDMRQTWLGRLLETGAASPAERRLADQRGADFFTWFHLEPVADPAVSVAHGTWHAFRPTGEVFRPLVELGVLVDLADFIVETRVGLDRTFIDGRNDMYGDAFFSAYLQAVRPDRARLMALLDKYKVRWTILDAGYPAVQILDLTPGWKRLYADKYAVVHVRT